MKKTLPLKSAGLLDKLPSVGFIGGGNMARSLIGGLIQDGYSPAAIQVCDPDTTQRERLLAQFNIKAETSAAPILDRCECLVLAVKPQTMHTVISQIREPTARTNPLLISIAAGIRVATLEKWLQREAPIVRCMPNTPALIQTGATALYANPRITEQQGDIAETLLRSVGLTVWLQDETLLDAVTALSGSGPAYIFLVIEAMQAAGIALGLSPEYSRLLSLQTAFGAAKMALEDKEPVSILRERVTSKGGTTERALEVFRNGQLPELFLQAMTAACQRSQELADDLGRGAP
ncbi:MAG TPA: pyrroline-5-carboxylate reductase [Gammaproteobacteria bacterium]|nr:pyrroline-5-carboxylate reductase [Gammaproteobacteria bacterium]